VGETGQQRGTELVWGKNTISHYISVGVTKKKKFVNGKDGNATLQGNAEIQGRGKKKEKINTY